MRQNFLYMMISCFLFSCGNQQSEENKIAGNEIKKDTISCPPGSSKLDIAKIETITGMKGVEKNGEYKITVPQNDLKIVVDGFKITPPMGLGSWAAFTP